MAREYTMGAKAKKKLGWEPKISFEELVKEMVQLPSIRFMNVS